VAEFWELVIRDEPPEDSQPSIDIIKRTIREPNKIVNVPVELLWDYQDANELRKNAQKLEDICKRELLAALGDAEVGQTEAGSVKYMEQTKKESITKASTFRVMRIKKGDDYEQLSIARQARLDGGNEQPAHPRSLEAGSNKDDDTGKDGVDSPISGKSATETA